ncbi:MAG: hypothetical protein K2L07_11550 [Lachnospiraceae bacterium]|nr:hypothetical protein [Lachnospiraceae bacterium]
MDKLLAEELYYPEEIKQRVRDIIMNQRRKYQYIFMSGTGNKSKIDYV